MDFGLLFGAGTSAGFGLPSTETLTRKIQDPEVMRSTVLDPVYTLVTRLRAGDGKWLEMVHACLCRLKCVVDDYDITYPSTNLGANFEVIYDLATQLHTVLSCCWGDNPALGPLLDRVGSELKSLGATGDTEELQDLAYAIANHIHDVLSRELSNYRSTYSDHSLLRDALIAREGKPLDVFTLNFDRQIEGYCSDNSIELIDGFGQTQAGNGIRPWEAQRYETDTKCVRLFKLHGSIDWFHWRSSMPNNNSELFGISTAPSLEQTVMPDGTPAEKRRPMLIVGTHIKFYEYSRGQPLEMFCAAKRAWDQLNILLAAGYGFRDMGINRLIHYWLEGNVQRKLVVIARCRQSLEQQAACFFSGPSADKWKENGKLLFFNEDTSFESLFWSDVWKFVSTI